MAAWSGRARAGQPLSAHLQGLAMLVTCTLWFILHSVIGFRSLMGDTANDDWIDLIALELVFAFPGLILHTVLLESAGDCRRARTAQTLVRGAGGPLRRAAPPWRCTFPARSSASSPPRHD